jgi:hypothetical protein
MSTPTTQRARILEAVRTEVERLATANRIPLRRVRRGAWLPGDSMRPSAVVSDDGAAKGTGNEQDDTTKDRLLKFEVILNLAADFGKDGDTIDWTDFVETLCLNLQNFNPKAGVRYMNVLEDTPVKVELGTVSEHLWVIQCECGYFVEVRAFA